MFCPPPPPEDGGGSFIDVVADELHISLTVKPVGVEYPPETVLMMSPEASSKTVTDMVNPILSPISKEIFLIFNV